MHLGYIGNSHQQHTYKGVTSRSSDVPLERNLIVGERNYRQSTFRIISIGFKN